MYIDYVRTFLSADERLTEMERNRIAQRIVGWAERNRVTDLGKLHDKLVDWVDRPSIREQNFQSVEQPIGEEGDLTILEDPRAQTPPEILIAGAENIITVKELHRFIAEEEPQLADVASSILKINGDVVYREDDLDPTQIHHRLTVIASRVKDGKLIIPDKKVLSIGFDTNENLQVRYRRGYSDEKFQRALEMRLKRFSYQDIGDAIGVSQTVVNKWLRHFGIKFDNRGGRVLPEGEVERRKEELYFAVVCYYDRHGFGPSVTDVHKQLDGLSFRNTNPYINCLVFEGKLKVIRRHGIYCGPPGGNAKTTMILPSYADENEIRIDYWKRGIVL